MASKAVADGPARRAISYTGTFQVDAECDKLFKVVVDRTSNVDHRMYCQLSLTNDGR